MYIQENFKKIKKKDSMAEGFSRIYSSSLTKATNKQMSK